MVEREARKVFGVTDEGLRDLEAHKREVVEFYEQFQDDAWERQLEDFGDLMRRAARLFKSFRRAARHGHISASAQAKVRTVLDQAVTKIEEILNEDGRR